MHTRKAAILALALAGTVGFVVLNNWPWRGPVEVKIIKAEPAQIVDDAGEELILVTLGFGLRVDAPWAYVQSCKVEVLLKGRWKMLDNTLRPGSVADGATRQELALIPPSAERCRIHLRYACASIPWRLGGWLSRRGVRLPPAYWSWAGWPQAQGSHPHWKSTSFELPLKLTLTPGALNF
jgi:hypothetical protein